MSGWTLSPLVAVDSIIISKFQAFLDVESPVALLPGRIGDSIGLDLRHQSYGHVEQLSIEDAQSTVMTTPAYYGDGFYIYVSGKDRTTGSPMTGRSPAFAIVPDMRCSDMSEGGWLGDTKLANPYTLTLLGLSDGMPLNITLTSPDQSFVVLLYNGTSVSGATKYKNQSLPGGISTGLYQITSSVQYRGIDGHLRVMTCSVPYSIKSIASLKILSPGNGTTYETAHQYPLSFSHNSVPLLHSQTHVERPWKSSGAMESAKIHLTDLSSLRRLNPQQYPLSFSYNASDLVDQTTYEVTLYNTARTKSQSLYYRLSLRNPQDWYVSPSILPIGQSDTFIVVMSPSDRSEPNVTSTPFTIHNSYCSGYVRGTHPIVRDASSLLRCGKDPFFSTKVDQRTRKKTYLCLKESYVGKEIRIFLFAARMTCERLKCPFFASRVTRDRQVFEMQAKRNIIPAQAMEIYFFYITWWYHRKLTKIEKKPTLERHAVDLRVFYITNLVTFPSGGSLRPDGRVQLAVPINSSVPEPPITVQNSRGTQLSAWRRNEVDYYWGELLNIGLISGGSKSYQLFNATYQTLPAPQVNFTQPTSNLTLNAGTLYNISWVTDQMLRPAALWLETDSTDTDTFPWLSNAIKKHESGLARRVRHHYERDVRQLSVDICSLVDFIAQHAPKDFSEHLSSYLFPTLTPFTIRVLDRYPELKSDPHYRSMRNSKSESRFPPPKPKKASVQPLTSKKVPDPPASDHAFAPPTPTPMVVQHSGHCESTPPPPPLKRSAPRERHRPQPPAPLVPPPPFPYGPVIPLEAVPIRQLVPVSLYLTSIHDDPLILWQVSATGRYTPFGPCWPLLARGLGDVRARIVLRDMNNLETAYGKSEPFWMHSDYCAGEVTIQLTPNQPYLLRDHIGDGPSLYLPCIYHLRPPPETDRFVVKIKITRYAVTLYGDSIELSSEGSYSSTPMKEIYRYTPALPANATFVTFPNNGLRVALHNQWVTPTFPVDPTGPFGGLVAEVVAVPLPTVNFTRPTVNETLSVGTLYNISWATDRAIGPADLWLEAESTDAATFPMLRMGTVPDATWNLWPVVTKDASSLAGWPLLALGLGNVRARISIRETNNHELAYAKSEPFWVHTGLASDASRYTTATGPPETHQRTTSRHTRTYSQDPCSRLVDRPQTLCLPTRCADYCGGEATIQLALNQPYLLRDHIGDGPSLYLPCIYHLRPPPTEDRFVVALTILRYGVTLPGDSIGVFEEYYSSSTTLAEILPDTPALPTNATFNALSINWMRVELHNRGVTPTFPVDPTGPFSGLVAEVVAYQLPDVVVDINPKSLPSPAYAAETVVPVRVSFMGCPLRPTAGGPCQDPMGSQWQIAAGDRDRHVIPLSWVRMRLSCLVLWLFMHDSLEIEVFHTLQLLLSLYRAVTSHFSFSLYPVFDLAVTLSRDVRPNEGPFQMSAYWEPNPGHGVGTSSKEFDVTEPGAVENPKKYPTKFGTPPIFRGSSDQTLSEKPEISYSEPTKYTGPVISCQARADFATAQGSLRLPTDGTTSCTWSLALPASSSTANAAGPQSLWVTFPAINLDAGDELMIFDGPTADPKSLLRVLGSATDRVFFADALLSRTDALTMSLRRGARTSPSWKLAVSWLAMPTPAIITVNDLPPTVALGDHVAISWNTTLSQGPPLRDGGAQGLRGRGGVLGHGPQPSPQKILVEAIVPGWPAIFAWSNQFTVPINTAGAAIWPWILLGCLLGAGALAVPLGIGSWLWLRRRRASRLAASDNQQVLLASVDNL
ncbi:hypothetical protein PAPYR_11055 [Paratrimastix pyriformis]|uniref:Uncharacterized protein n=1 Tax=Paratrimastix pyriformis TaxID=342808 RepID=A0ABQ8UAC7_9EUKA|nr:hypothetical protein PAPYR_11055 [Paratrimastix pyriformis]